MKSDLACERECIRGEDYRLVKLKIINFNQVVVVERRGPDATRLCNIDHAHR
ncbi:hypothetical protein HanRHA438_Chr07g0306771 [Helianthus annuus]|uniref:Uncharacterized protein n=1 Tax=Helianthus annuus TaxID=4232 RepID=A0A9K3NFW7_HELAN|nr:hypothetical protein HanXRQr2_Chr07g0296491 [Helianthus annuus]KAJ0550306.1 hypothetical protein HanHA300_Chr07g0243921 [Helianthus annuus]KAJ0556989.1 hypothetical protein HanIR_Chr07g0320061 [Helianthus annuus]KAJ0563260.1 hypothetical protein HanHA89_Chr07g0261101 [Helianthus annuus]KAJ0731366.1 hypothetical protein HanOQP8_Chr07g0251141 [Helianthus annuus]